MLVFQRGKLKKTMINLAFFTSTRGDISIINPLLKEIQKDKRFKYKLYVHGTHLEKKFGYTINEIKKLNLKITKKFKSIYPNDSNYGISKSQEILNKKVNEIFRFEKFDAVVLLGDRIERIPIITNCIIYNKLLFHLHGGEITKGSSDDIVRNIISKSSHLHFVICNQYKQNLIKMRESQKRIFNVGSLAINKKLLKKIKNKNEKPLALLTYHPETISKKKFNWIKNLKIILKVLKKKNIKTIITAPGHERDSEKNIKFLENFTKNNNNFKLFKSLGSKEYFKTMSKSSFVIGNSSSGIIETPYFRIPTINIGERQKGRFMHKSIINTLCKTKSIENSIDLALNKNFTNKIEKMNFYFGDGNSAKKILNIISNKIKDKSLLIK